MTDGPLLAQVLRAAAAGVGLVAATACTVLDDLADRIDPPGLDYAGFGTRLDGIEPVDGYYVPEPRERM